MATGMTILGREWINDPDAPGGRKEVVTFSVESSALIPTILMRYPNTGNGSYAICFSEGVFKNLIDGIWM